MPFSIVTKACSVTETGYYLNHVGCIKYGVKLLFRTGISKDTDQAVWIMQANLCLCWGRFIGILVTPLLSG